MLSCSTCGIRFREQPVAAPVSSSIEDQFIDQPQYNLKILTYPIENPQFETYSLTNPANACYANALFTVLASTPAFYNSLDHLFFNQDYGKWQERLSFVYTDIKNMHILKDHYELSVLREQDKFNFINDDIRKKKGEEFSSKNSNDWIALYEVIQRLFNEAVDARTPKNSFRLPGLGQYLEDPKSFDIGGAAEELLYIHVFGQPTEFSTKKTILELTGASTDKELLSFKTTNGKRYEAYAIIGYVGGHYNCVVRNSWKQWKFFDNQQTQLLEYPYTAHVGKKGREERIPKNYTLRGYINKDDYFQVSIFYQRVDN